MPENETSTDVAALAVQLLSAYLGNNTVAPETIADLIRSTKAALTQDVSASPEAVTPEIYTPAVSVRKSLASPDHILSLIDGKPYKLLKRHLKTHGLTPEQYRERYSLPAAYPMVAPAFATKRREIAEEIGLGRRAKSAGAETATSEVADTIQPPVSLPATPVEAASSSATKPKMKDAAPAKAKRGARKAPVKAKPAPAAPKKSLAKPDLKQTEDLVAVPVAEPKPALAVEGEAPAVAAKAKRTSGKPTATGPIAKRVPKGRKTPTAQPKAKASPTPEPASEQLSGEGKPSRSRRKLAMFGRSDSEGKAEDSSPVSEASVTPVPSLVEDAEKSKVSKAPRQKRMARTPKKEPSAEPKSVAATKN